MAHYRGSGAPCLILSTFGGQFPPMHVLWKAPGFVIHWQGIGAVNTLQKTPRLIPVPTLRQVDSIESGDHRPEAGIVELVGLVLEGIGKTHLQVFPIAVDGLNDRIEGRQQRHIVRDNALIANKPIDLFALPIVCHTQ